MHERTTWRRLLLGLTFLLLWGSPAVARSQNAPNEGASDEVGARSGSLRAEFQRLLKAGGRGNFDSAFPQNLSQLDQEFPSPSAHGFFMLGKENVLLYHSAAFEETDHAYQMIVQVSLAANSAKLDYETFYEIAIQQGWTWITHNIAHANGSPHNTEKFTLPHLHMGGVTGFTGDIGVIKRDGSAYLRHFLPGARFTIDRILYFRRFDLSADYPETLSYLLFGMGDEAFMAHYLTKGGTTAGSVNALAFDDVVRVHRPAWLAGRDDLFESVIEVKIPSISVSSLPTSSPLNGTLDVTVFGNPSYDGTNFTVEVRDEYWFDTHVINGR